MNTDIFSIIEGYFIALAIIYVIGMIIVKNMASNRGYSPIPWILVCLFVTPLIPIFILALFIQTPQMYVKRHLMIQAEINKTGSDFKPTKKIKSIKEWWSDGFIPADTEENIKK